MKIKKIFISVLALFILLVGISYYIMQDSIEQASDDQKTHDPNEKTDLITEVVEEITDPVVLEKLWQEYIYDSIATVCNSRNFTTAVEIDPDNIAKFCWFKYINEYGKESLELQGGGSTLRVLPLSTVLEYAERYFNLTSLDVSKITDGEYDPERQVFTYNLGDGHRPSYTENNGWNHRLAKVTKSSNGTITALMEIYESSKSKRLELTKTLTLKEREDGSLYFVSGKWDYINNNLVSLTGGYQRFDKIIGFEGNMDELRMIGETDGKIILAYVPYPQQLSSQADITAALMLVNPDTLAVEKKLDSLDNFWEYGVKLVGDRIIVRLKDKIITIDKNLEQQQDIPLPTALADKIKREPKYDQNGVADVYFGGYDISADLTRIVYADEQGLKLYNMVDNSEKLLVEPAKIPGNKFFNKSYHCIPRLINNDQKVVTTMTGYDYSTGFTVYDLFKGTTTTLDNVWGESSSETVYNDSGLLNVNAYLYDAKDASETIQTLYFDFHNNEVSVINLDNTGDTGFIRTADYAYVGMNHAAFITQKWDANDYANSMYYLNLLDLKTKEVKEKIVSVKAAATHILGVLSDGRVLFWYHLNPGENGVCITK